MPTELASKFIQLSEDAETTEFLKKSQEKSDWLFTQLLHSFVKFVLSWVMTKTSVNGSVIVFMSCQSHRRRPHKKKTTNIVFFIMTVNEVTPHLGHYVQW